jgi:hypothetical protein
MKLKSVRVIFILLVLIFTSCSVKNKTDNNSPEQNVQAINNKILTPQTGGEFFLKYNLHSGKKIRYKIVTTSNNYQELIADSTIRSEASQKVEYIISVKTIEVSDTDKTKLNFYVESIKATGNINGQKINYDSKYIQSTQERLIFAQYEAIKKKSFSIDIDKTGEILKLYNTKKMTDELISIQETGTKMTSNQKKELAKNFIDVALRPLAKQIFQKFPDKKVSINSTWNENYLSQLASFQIENVVTYTIADIVKRNKDSVIVINAALSTNWRGNHTASEKGMNFYFYDPIISGSGIVKFNKTIGLITYSETTTKMELSTDITGTDLNGKFIKGKRTDNSSNTNITQLLQ